MRRPPPFSQNQKKRDFQRPKVVFQPRAVEGMQAGMNKLVALVRPTLGPLPHIVAHEKIAGRGQLPELLDSGGTIARRVIQISDRQEDVGFMYLRHVLWKLQEAEGDGTATAAVLFDSIFNQGRRYVTAGGNAMSLREHLEHGMRQILTELDRQTTQLHGRQRLAGLARTICYDDELAKMLGEIFDIIGAYGRLEVRKGSGLELTREYVEGMYWDSGMRSREMTNAEFGMRANLENAAILISDVEINEPEQLVPLLQLAIKNNIKQILLVSGTLSDKAMSVLLTKSNQERVFVVAVKIPGLASDVQRDAMEDLAVLTGGRPLLRATNDTIESVRLEDLGRARRIWADREFFGIIGGKGEPRTLRQHIATLRQVFRNATDANDRKRLLERLGKLTGGSATLFVGGISPTQVEERVELAKRTADAMRGAMREGVVLGGGIALLNCRAVLRECLKKNQADGNLSDDERAAYTMLIQALETPFRTLLENAGFWPGSLLAEVERSGPDYGFDVLARKVVNLREVGLFDAAPVVKGGLRSAVAGAALALTTEAIVHRKNPPDGLQT
jgi:chaperonin GroEL